MRAPPYQREGVETLGEALGLEEQPQLVHLSLLLRRQVPGVPVRGNGRRRGEVVVIVLGVELQGRGGGFSHCVGFGRVEAR